MTESRNARLGAEFRALSASPLEPWRVGGRFGAADEDEARLRRDASFLAHTAYMCSGTRWDGEARVSCRHVFTDGDVIFRYWDGRWGRARTLVSRCIKCALPGLDDVKFDGEIIVYGRRRIKTYPCANSCGARVAVPNHYWRYRETGRTPGEAPDRDYYSPFGTCSQRCADEWSKKRRRVEHDERQCEVCENVFTPTRADARHCSNACRQAAYRARKTLGVQA